MCAGILLGSWRLAGLIHDQNIIRANIGRQLELTGIIAADPKTADNKTALILRDVSLSDNVNAKNGQIYAQLSGTPPLTRSDQVTLSGELLSGFGDYDAFLLRPTLIAASKPDPPDFALMFRDFLSQRIQKSLNNADQSGLALGFLLGEKAAIPDDLNNILRQVGLAHVVVASGYALSVLVQFARKILGRFSRFATIAGALLLIVGFVTTIGFSASLLRAGIASAIALFSWYFGRKLHPLRLLLYIAALSLLLRPVFFFSVAWQLSFASYAGILLLYPVLTKFLYGGRQPSTVMSIGLVSFSAQLFCLPLSAYCFGAFAVLGIVANILVTPFIPAAMAATFLVGLFMWPIFVVSLQLILKYQLAVINWINNIPWNNIELTSGDVRIFAAYGLITAALALLCWRCQFSYRPSFSREENSDYDKIFSC